MIGPGRARCDPVSPVLCQSQRCLRKVADVSVLGRLNEGPAVSDLEYADIVAPEQLPVTFAVRRREEIGIARDLMEIALDKAICRHLSLQMFCGNPTVGRCHAAVHQRSSTFGSAPRMARTPCPSPPFARPGSGFGCQE